MQRHPERVAWTVLSVAFVVCCLLVVGIPLGLRSYVLNATDDQDTQLQVIEGTVLVQRAQGGQPIGVTRSTGSTALSPKSEIITDGSSWAILDLFERSHVTLYSNTRAGLETMLMPRFGLSHRPNQVILSLTGGLMRVGVALPGERDTEFRVVTPHTTVHLEEGSYRIEATNNGTAVTVVRGQASVGENPGGLLVPQGRRTWVELSGEPADPLPAALNLIENGDFQQPLETGWITNTLVLTTGVEPPKVEIVRNNGRHSVRLFRRQADDGIHSEVSIYQPLDQDVRDYVRLEISLDVRLDFQSLSGGGLLSSEFPIILRLDYKDRWGNDQFWTHGFYYQNQAGYPIAADPWGRPSGEQIPRGVWYPYESGNLLELLGESGPIHLTRLTIYASGWNYDSLVSEVQLVVE
jgi:hypothetical protein